MKYIYIDGLFVLSMFTDYLLCLITGRFCGLYLKRRRYFFAALFGACYSVAVFLPGMSFLALPVMELVSAGIMGLIAFGAEQRLLRCIGVFLAVSASFGGIIWAITLHAGEGPKIDLRLLLGCFILCYVGLAMLSHTKLRKDFQQRVHVELSLRDRKTVFLALVDSGNCLADPVTGASVMIVSPHALLPLFPQGQQLLEIRDAVSMVEAADKIPELKGSFRLLPYKNIGGEGLLPVFRPDELRVEGKPRQGMLVGISAQAAADGFEAIIP